MPSEEALNATFNPNYRLLCHVDVQSLVDAARDALHLDPSLALSEVRLLKCGSFNKVFFIHFGSESIAVVARVPFDVPAARDPIRLASQVATLDFLQSHKLSVPVPRVIGASLDSANPSHAPYILSEFCTGTSITIKEWLSDMSDPDRSSLIDLLAELWVSITAPVPFKTIGSLLRESSVASDTPQSHAHDMQVPGFRVIPMIPQCPDASTRSVDPSSQKRSAPQTLLEHWTHELDVRRNDILALWPENEPSTVLWKDKSRTFTLKDAWKCFHALQELAATVAPLDPLVHAPAMALIHTDFSIWKNILFSGDRSRVQGVVDWDDAMIVPRDLAALYPEELTHSARGWGCDPPDVFAIPPDTPYEEQGLWGVAIQETQQRRLWREAIQRRDPQLAAMYVDRRARIRRRVQYLVSGGYLVWMSHRTWLLSESLAEAHAIEKGVS